MEYKLEIGNRTKKIKIDTVPYKAHKINAEMASNQAELVDLASEEGIINQRIEEVRKDKSDGWYLEVRGLRKDLKEITKEAKRLAEGLFFDIRWKIIKLILEKNGYSEDETLMSKDFWESDADFSEVDRFINFCLSGENKKKDTSIKA